MNPTPQFLVADEDGVLTPHPLGLVECSNDAYHGGPGTSKSALDAIANASPLHFWYKYVNPERVRAEPTPAMVMGSAVHSAVLEPDLFPLEYVQAPTGINKRTNAGKAEFAAFEAANKGKTVLDVEDFATCLAVRDAVHRHPVAAGLLTGGKAEQSFFAIDPETGELIKCRTDYMAGDMIIDLKTTKDASPSEFAKSVANFRYDVQQAWYNHVLECAFGEHPETWAFLAVETSPPYAIGIYYLDPFDVMRAKTSALKDLARIVAHKKSGEWPDYGHSVQQLTLPGWVKR